MAVNCLGLRDTVVQLMASEWVPLTEEQRAAMAAEFESDPTGRGYADMDAAGRLRAFALPYEVPNPEPQGVIAREWVPALDVMNVLKQHGHEDGRSSWRKLCDMAELDADMWEAMDTIRSYGAARESLRLGNPQVSKLLPAFVALGLLSAAELAYLTSVPDPNWTPTVWAEARSDVVLGPGVVPTLGEVAG